MTSAQCDALDRLETLAAAASAEQTWTDDPSAQGPRVTVRWIHPDGRVERASVDRYGIIGAAELEQTARTDRTLKGQAQDAAAAKQAHRQAARDALTGKRAAITRKPGEALHDFRRRQDAGIDYLGR